MSNAGVARRIALLVAGVAALVVPFVGCNRHEAKSKNSPQVAATDETNTSDEPAVDATPESRMSPGEIFNKGKPSDVMATWYEVPPESLAKRRAGVEELSAAHNRLPIGTLVRVTHLANGRSVDVRITDRGITKRGVKLDLCKEAAEKLGMVSEGVAKVRMQVLEEQPPIASNSGTAASDSPAVTAQK